VFSARGIALSANCHAQRKSQLKRNCAKREKSCLAPKVDSCLARRIRQARSADYKYVLEREKHDFSLFFSPNAHPIPNNSSSTIHDHLWPP